MEVKNCFEQGCPNEAEYVCQCISPGTYSCEFHVGKHLKLGNAVHAFESIPIETCKETKEEILKLLAEKILKYNKSKETLLNSFNQNLLNSESNLKELIKVLDKSSDELNYFFSKIIETKKILKSEQDPILGLLSFQPKDALEKLKALIPTHLSWLESAEDELKVFSTLNHPYIMGLDSYFKVDNKEKHSNLLKVIISKQIKNRYFDEKEIWKYFIQISFALEAFHSCGYIQRDIKPENIFLDKNKDVKLMDFELSRYLHASSVEASPPSYSPEMCNGDAPVKESDIWALGCVLYKLCNLEDPFKGNKQKIQKGEYMPIKSQYSMELKYLIDWCLMKEINKRLTINKLISHRFIVDKVIELGIRIPKTSDMNIFMRNLLKAELGKNLKLECELRKLSNETIKKEEIECLKAEIYSLKNIIVAKGNDIEILRLNVVKIAKFLQKRKALNEKQIAEVKNSIKALIVETENIKKKFDYLEKDLNLKEAEIAQNQIQNLRDKRAEILKSSKNNSKLEEEFRSACLTYENNFNALDASVMQAYQDYVRSYDQKTSLFNLYIDQGRTNLVIYNTETQIQELKILQTPYPINCTTCITQLPNGKLFCFGSNEAPGIALLIEENYRVEKLPSGTDCWLSSAIYFNNNIYCFGGINDDLNLNLSIKFDLDKNQWKKLKPLPVADAKCNSIIFNECILISREISKNLWRYSIDKNSFKTIPYDFAENKGKILINEDRLYLIECFGSIYESEIGSDTAWREIAYSTIGFNPTTTYWLYNKGGIYFGWGVLMRYAKFNLNDKRLEICGDGIIFDI